MTAWIWKNKIAWLVALVLTMTVFDQVTKVWAQGALTEVREVTRTAVVDGTPQKVTEERHVQKRTIEVIPGLFNFKYAENRAAAFSLTQSIPESARRPMLLFISLVACGFIIYWYLKLKTPDALLMTAFALIVGGALGNLIDRARLGYVIDFLDFYVASGGLATWLEQEHTLPVLGVTVRLSSHWPTFNIADICIVSGAFGVILRTMKPQPESKEDAAPAAPAAASASTT
jgi:signal peptidase II